MVCWWTQVPEAVSLKVRLAWIPPPLGMNPVLSAFVLLVPAQTPAAGFLWEAHPSQSLKPLCECGEKETGTPDTEQTLTLQSLPRWGQVPHAQTPGRLCHHHWAAGHITQGTNAAISHGSPDADRVPCLAHGSRAAAPELGDPIEAQGTLLFPTEQVAPAQPSAFGHGSQPVPGGNLCLVSLCPLPCRSLFRNTLLYALPALRVGLRRIPGQQPPSRNEAGPRLARPRVLGAALLRTLPLVLPVY